MFADESARPEGLHYQPDFISAQEEAALIGNIGALPLAPFQFGIYEGKRRVVFFGSRYDFTHQRLEAAEEPPAWLMPLAGRVERFAALPSGSIKHALCTEYDVGAGIGWHRDKKHFDQVFGLPRLGLQIPFPPQDRQQVGTFHAQRATTLALRDDRRLPPYLGAQHPAGRDPTLFDHLPYHDPSPSIGFDLKSRSAAVSCRTEVCYPFCRKHGMRRAMTRRAFITLLGVQIQMLGPVNHFPR
jgi:hypothetical protein